MTGPVYKDEKERSPGCASAPFAYMRLKTRVQIALHPRQPVKEPRRVSPLQRRKKSNYFLRRHVRRRKYRSACKRARCSSPADSACAAVRPQTSFQKSNTFLKGKAPAEKPHRRKSRFTRCCPDTCPRRAARAAPRPRPAGRHDTSRRATRHPCAAWSHPPCRRAAARRRSTARNTRT